MHFCLAFSDVDSMAGIWVLVGLYMTDRLHIAAYFLLEYNFLVVAFTLRCCTDSLDTSALTYANQDT